MKYFKLLALVLFISVTLGITILNAQSPYIIRPSQGGTGIGTATIGDVGLCLKVLDDSPFTYELGTCGSGGGGSGGGTWSTTTSQVSGQLINYPNNATDVVAIGSNSTTTAEFWFDPNTKKAVFGNNVFTHNQVLIGNTSTSSTAQLEIKPVDINDPLNIFNSIGNRIIKLNNSSSLNLNGGSLTPTLEAMLHLTHSYIDSYDPYLNLADGNSYPLLTHNLVNTTGSTTGLGFSVTSTSGNVGASIVFERTGSNSQGKLNFYTKQSTTSGVAPSHVLTLSEAGNVGIGDTSPVSLFTVGSGDLFQVNSSGAITAIAGISGATGNYDLGGATFLEIPNGTNPTADDPGEIAHDTTDNQLILDDFVVAKATQKIWSVTVASTSPAFITGGLLPIPTELNGYVITAIRCRTQDGTSKVIAIEDESANATEDVTCDADGAADDGTITNASVTAGEEMLINFGATTGSVNYVTISVFGTWVRE